MTSQEATAPPTVEPTASAQLKELARRSWPESHPFRLEVEATSATDTKIAVAQRVPTLIRLSRRAPA